MSETTELTQEAAAPGELKPFETLLGVVIRPARTFDRMREAPRTYWWILAAVTAVLLVISLAVQAPITARTSEEQIRTQLDLDGSGDLDEQEQQMFDQAMTFSTNPLFIVVIPSITALIGLALGYGVRGGVLYLLGMALGGRAQFGQMIRMAVWTTLPNAVRALLSVIVVLATGRLPATGLTAAMTVEEIASAPVLAAFLQNIDLFTLWSLVLIALGTAATARFSRGKGAIVAAIWWALVTLVAVGLAAVSKLLIAQAGFAG